MGKYVLVKSMIYQANSTTVNLMCFKVFYSKFIYLQSYVTETEVYLIVTVFECMWDPTNSLITFNINLYLS